MTRQRLFFFVQLFSLAMLTWFIFGLLGRVHAVLAWLLLLLAIGNLIAEWIIRHDADLFRALHAKPVAKQFLDFVCWCIGYRPPLAADSGEARAQIQLHCKSEFREAERRAKGGVRGHDEVIDRIFESLHDSLTLRRHRQAMIQPPLTSLLLVGGEGVGKCYLARTIGKLLYAQAGSRVFDCRRVTATQLLGTKDAPGELLRAVSEQPFQLLVIEHVDRASVELRETLHQLMTTGRLTAAGADEAVYFAHTTLIMTTTTGADALATLADSVPTRSVWRTRAVALLEAETTLSPTWLDSLGEILLCRRPSDLVKAEVASLLFRRIAKQHQIRLCHIDPEILVCVVIRLNDQAGFAVLPERVRRLMKRPLLNAAQSGQESLSLRIRRTTLPSHHQRPNDSEIAANS